MKKADTDHAKEMKKADTDRARKEKEADTNIIIAGKEAERAKLEQEGRGKAQGAFIAATIDSFQKEGAEELSAEQRMELAKVILQNTHAAEQMKLFPKGGVMIANGGFGHSGGAQHAEAGSTDAVVALAAAQLAQQRGAGIA